MALPQQGTETTTPTVLAKAAFTATVLMALPQQGTETGSPEIVYYKFLICVNGLTPTGDGNINLW